MLHKTLKPQYGDLPILRKNQLIDTLYNCSKDCTQDFEHYQYAKGIFVGVVGTVMSLNDQDLPEAIAFIKPLLPNDFDEQLIPNSWKEAYHGRKS